MAQKINWKGRADAPRNSKSILRERERASLPDGGNSKTWPVGCSPSSQFVAAQTCLGGGHTDEATNSSLVRLAAVRTAPPQHPVRTVAGSREIGGCCRVSPKTNRHIFSNCSSRGNFFKSVAAAPVFRPRPYGKRAGNSSNLPDLHLQTENIGNGGRECIRPARISV